jgi:predicted Zn-dependent peptidase
VSSPSRRWALGALIAALLPAASLAAPRERGASRPEVVSYPDGLELVVYPQPSARRAALWLVVRAGGVNDPHRKGGLAHLVEHLAFGGSHDLEGRAFFDEARAAGATVNAHTYPERITFELDVSADRLDALGGRFLGLVTSPAWQDARIERERGIIETEAAYHSTEGLLSLFDMAVFPAPQQGAPLAGTAESRTTLDVQDAAAFFSRAMAPSNLTVILTGAVTPAQGRELVERSFRIPPAREGERTVLPVERPTLPVEQRLQAGVVVVTLGYLVDPADRAYCPAVASLLDLRLMLAVQVESRRVSRLSATCARFRGNDFLVLLAFTSTLDTSELPQAMRGAVARLADAPPTAQERAVVDGTLSRELERAVGDPTALVERISVLAAERLGPAVDLSALRESPLPAAGRIREMVRRSLTPQREVLLHFSPMLN